MAGQWCNAIVASLCGRALRGGAAPLPAELPFPSAVVYCRRAGLAGPSLASRPSCCIAQLPVTTSHSACPTACPPAVMLRRKEKQHVRPEQRDKGEAKRRERPAGSRLGQRTGCNTPGNGAGTAGADRRRCSSTEEVQLRWRCHFCCRCRRRRCCRCRCCRRRRGPPCIRGAASWPWLTVRPGPPWQSAAARAAAA